jgi:hypothetical protein
MNKLEYDSCINPALSCVSQMPHVKEYYQAVSPCVFEGQNKKKQSKIATRLGKLTGTI